MRLLLSWGANGTTGWGWNGANLTRHASLAGWTVFSDGGIDWSALPPEWRLEGWTIHAPDGGTYDAAIYAAGNGVVPTMKPGLAKKFLIETFIEDAAIPAEIVTGYNKADAVIVGSRWNHELLTGVGVETRKVHTVWQGADQYVPPHPPPSEFFLKTHRRRIFSGGKLEFRKGQDIVVAAFREYVKSDPDALLVTAWQNSWYQTLKGIDAMGYVKGWPAIRPDGSLDIVGWCEKNGIPRKNVVDVGLVPSWALQRVMALCDVAVFPNRCEGGTNLVAMECLRVGVPTWATCRTGQEDLTEWGAGRLAFSEPITASCSLYKGTRDWVEANLTDLTRCMAGDGGDRPPAGLGRLPSWSDHRWDVLALCV